MSEAPTLELPTRIIPTDNTCGNCKHGCVASPDFKQPLECRRFPPTLTSFLAPRGPANMELMHSTQYPRVPRLGAPCGEWVPKFDKQN